MRFIGLGFVWRWSRFDRDTDGFNALGLYHGRGRKQPRDLNTGYTGLKIETNPDHWSPLVKELSSEASRHDQIHIEM